MTVDASAGKRRASSAPSTSKRRPLRGAGAVFTADVQLEYQPAAGYMPELNVLCGIADYSTQSGQPVTKHLEVEVTPAREKGAGQ